MNPFLSIKARLLTFALCISLIPITIITTIYYFHSRSALKFEIIEKLKAVAESRERHILSTMERMRVRTVDFSSDGFIRNGFERIARGRDSKQGVVIRLNAYLKKNKLPLYPHRLIAIILVDKFGKVVSSTDEKLVGKDFSGQDAFAQGIPKGYGETCVGQPQYSPYLDENCIFISAPIISRYDTEILGFIINAYNLITLNEITKIRVGMGETGEVYLVNRDKTMLTESRFIEDAPFKQVVVTEPVRKVIDERKEMVGIYQDYRDNAVVGASMDIAEYGWVLLAEMDKAEAFAPLKMLSIVALILGVVGTAAVTSLGIIFAVSTSQPIEDLTKATEMLAGGDLKHRVKVTRKDEIGSLANSFNAMSEELERVINEHKQAEAVLKESEQRFRTIFDCATDGILLADMETKQFYTGNKTICQILGYSPDEIKSLGVMDIHPAEDLSYVKEQFEKQAKRETILAKDIPVKRRDGSIFYVDINTALVPLDGKTYLMGIFRDITERKRAEEALRKTGASLANAQRIAHLGNWNWDIVKNELRWSDEIYHIFGLFPQAFSATYEAFLDSVHPDDREFVKKSVNEALYERKPYNIDHRIVLPDGSERIVHEQAEVIFDNTGRAIQMDGTVQDVTERKRMEQVQDRLVAILEATTDFVGFANAKDIHILYVNTAGRKMTGIGEEEDVTKLKITDVHPGWTNKMFLEEIIPTAIRDGIWRGECAFLSRDGREIPVSMIFMSHKTPGGAVENFSTISRDISERKRTEEEINLLLNMTMSISEAGSFHSVLNIVLCKVCESTGWIYGEAWLPSSNGKYLECGQVWHNNSEGLEDFRKKSQEFTFTPGVGLPGRIWSSKKPEWKRYITTEREFPRVQYIKKYGFKAAMGIPVIADSEVVAVLNFFVREQREEDERWIRLVSSVAIQLGSVIQRKRAEEELRKLNETLEQRVAERTTALVKANEELQVKIEERKRAEESLRKSEVRLTNAQRISHLGNWDWDVVKNQVFGSDEFYRIFGLGPEAFAATYESFLEYIHPDDIEFVKKSVNEALCERKPYSIEFRIVLQDHSEKIVHSQGEVIFDDTGKAIQMNGTIQDITERKRVEEELRKLFNAVEQSSCSVVITDIKGNIEYVNPKFSRVTGYAPEEVIGQNPRVLKSDEKPPEEYKCLWDTITSGREWEGEFHNKKKTGELYWEFASISPIRNPEGVITHFVAVKEDITERKRAEDELRKQSDHLENLTRQLTASNKELEAFCYSVSHDLRAPLRSINGFSKALMEDCSDKLDAQGKNYLQRVMAASQYMGQLIDDLLNLSRITRSEMRRKTVDLSALAKKIATELHEAQPERQAEFIIAEKLIAYGDPQLLRIALTNLLGNAWKFTRKRPRARIEFGVTKHDGKPVYFVRDNGDGFDMAFVNKLFGAFHRLHSTTEFEGTGIGLATVQRIIHRHGGQIWAEGAVDQGATFYFTFTI